MNNEKGTGDTPPKGKRSPLTGALIGLVVLLALAVVVLATPLKEVLFSKKSAPAVSLELIGEPLEKEGKYRFEVEALVTGKPLPKVTFNRDDSAGEAGENRAWIWLAPGEKYALSATAENSAGRATASIELEASDEPEKPQEPGEPQKPGETQKPGEPQKPEESQKPKENNSPVIKEIEINKSVVFTGISCQITVVASDLDGDPLSYEWSGDGSIADASANPMTWIAPDTKGDYTIKVTVKDGRGGTATMSKVITVNNPLKPPAIKRETTLKPVEGGESGWIIENDTVITTATYAGDNKYNQMVRGFVSFDISELADRTVGEARLSMNSKIFGNPSAMGDLAIGSAYWGARPLTVEDYNKGSRRGIGWPKTYNFTITSKRDSENAKDKYLVEELQRCIDEGSNRFQIRFQFSKKESNNNNSPDGVQYEFKDISLYIEYK